MLKRPKLSVGLQLATREDDCRVNVVVVQKLSERRFYEVRRPSLLAMPLHAFSKHNHDDRSRRRRHSQLGHAQGDGSGSGVRQVPSRN